MDVYSTYQVQIRPGNPQDTPTFCKFQSQQSDIFHTDKHNAKKKHFDFVVNIGISESEF